MLLPVYDKQVPIKEKLPPNRYELFKSAALKCKELPDVIVDAHNKLYPDYQLNVEDIAAAGFKDRSQNRSNNQGTLKLHDRYYLAMMDLYPIDITLFVPDETWFGKGDRKGLQQRLNLPENALGCLFPSTFIGDQQVYPLGLAAEKAGSDYWSNEFSFLYKVMNGFSQQEYEKSIVKFDKLLLSRFFALDNELTKGRYTFSSEEGRKSVKDDFDAISGWLGSLGCTEFVEHQNEWKAEWKNACDALKILEDVTDATRVNRGLISYALLAAEELPHLSAWAEHVTGSNPIYDKRGLEKQLFEVLQAKMRGDKSVKKLEDDIKY